MTSDSESQNLSFFAKLRIVLVGFLTAAAVVVLLPVAALFAGVIVAWVSAATGWFQSEETNAWLGVIFATYALYANIVVGPTVWFWISAKRLALSPKTSKVGTAILVTVSSLVCFWVISGEQAVTNPSRLEDVSDDGKLVLAASMRSNSSSLYKIDMQSGAAGRLTPSLRGYETEASFSPDGNRIVFAYRDNERQDSTIMLTDRAGDDPHPILTDRGNDSWPRFSPDGRTIYFIRTNRLGGQNGFDLFSTSLDGKNVRQLSHQHFSFNGEPYLTSAPVVSADGNQVLFTTGEDIKIALVSNTEQQPKDLLFELPNAPRSRQYVSSYFSSDNRGVVFMAATEGEKRIRLRRLPA